MVTFLRIRNVNVFIDGHFYSELMQQATGDEMKLATGYSLYPIFEKIFSTRKFGYCLAKMKAYYLLVRETLPILVMEVMKFGVLTILI